MALVLRTVVGRPLTWTEGDDNLTYLEGLVPAPGGVDGELQYNDNGTFSGVPDLTYANSALQATGSFAGSFVGDLSGTASYALTASYAQNAPTASYVNLIAGPGITVNGLEITASVRSVNGVFAINGNVAAPLVQTVTGTSASFQSSGSGAVTASLADGLTWIVAGDANPAFNGDVYIYNSGSVGQWFPVAPPFTGIGDARYLQLSGVVAMAGNIDMDGYDITNGNLIGTASWAESAVSSSYPITVAGSTLRSVNPVGGNGASTINSIFLGGLAGAGATSADYSIFLGTNAGSGAINAPKSNFIGYFAGNAASGAYNSNFIGVNAGDGAINADKSNFVGHRAGNGATNALRSNFIGRYAGYYATNAEYSNFIGNEAGYQAPNAYESSFVGSQAGYQATNAYQSNFLGSNAGYQATNASQSIFLGIAAGQTATNADVSNFIGNSAGASATKARFSNFIGAAAGLTATNAEYSNFIGNSTGRNATSASYSTLIGYQVGYNVAGGTLGIKSNNIVIGTNITLPNGTKDSINLGGIIFATGSYSNTGGNPSSGSAGGRVGINVVSPTSTLDVLGSFNVTGTATLTSASVVGDMITNVGDTFATPAVIKIVSLTAAEYSGITPNANTLYVVI